jgi:hypothetical protein
VAYPVRLRLVEFKEPWIAHIPRMLAPVGEAIMRESLRAEQTEAESVTDEYAYLTVDDACDCIENLLGVAFVIAQLGITQTVGAIRGMEDNVLCDPTRALKGIRGTRHVVGDGVAEKVEVIHAFANYFKHRDEWNLPWDDLDARQQDTVAVLRRVGATETSTGNFRAAARFLSVQPYCGVVVLVDALREWRGGLEGWYRQRLRDVGILEDD